MQSTTEVNLSIRTDKYHTALEKRLLCWIQGKKARAIHMLYLPMVVENKNCFNHLERSLQPRRNCINVDTDYVL